MTAAKRKRLGLALIAVAAAAVVTAAIVRHVSAELPRRFAVVEEGQLYRSGSVSPEQLARLGRAYGIRRVVCLLNPEAPETQTERQAAENLGIQWCNVPLPGNGASTRAERQQILTLVTEAGAGPTLVHCAAGTNRTGLAVGLYRLHRQGWELERVLGEMRTFGFDDDERHRSVREALASEAAAAASSRPAGTQTEAAP